MGTFDTDPRIRATAGAFVADAAPWEPIPEDGLPRPPGPDTPGPGKSAARAQRRFLLSRARANAITRQSTLTRAPEWKAGAGCNLVGTEVLLIEAFDA
jgi:hypothetical protein